MSSRIGPAKQVQKRRCPLRFRGISKITLKVVVFHFRLRLPLILHLSSHFTKPEGTVPDPSRPYAATSSPRERLRAIHRQPAGWGPGPVPDPRANPFRDSGSILPTSLAYIVPSTVHSPWRRCGYECGRAWAALVLRIFKGAGAHGHRAASRCSSGRWTLPPVSRFEGGRYI
ncbi:hypothetical protein H5410_063989 [Solanum commersonii]|uniref:Uncharacterized protein n=1 Tax=Solanum commersonii TaxID=4109 RepID=A0A9J5W0K7_SOLCO|nr:hypothetical protein H5410_063989 [Solanum commersonii]